MSSLHEKVSPYTKELMKTWEASEQIIDKHRAMWMLKDPTSEYRKVC